ncbi:MAG: hypothetical protein WC408_06300, partial [Candidatus Micrarchaeia archaeon]
FFAVNFLFIVLALVVPNPALATICFACFYIAAFVAVDSVLSKLGFLSKACLAIVAGFASIATSVYFVSLALGYSRASIAASLAIVSAIFWIVSQKYGKAQMGNWKKEIASEARAHWLAIAATLLVFFGFLAINTATLWAPSEEGMVVAGWNWADSFAHVPVILSVNNGNFPPQVPFLAGEPLNYHWFADFLTAIYSKQSTMGFAQIMQVENSAYPALFFLLCYLIAFELGKNRKAALFAAAAALLCGSFAFTRAIPSISANPADFLKIITSDAYDNDWKEYQIPSLVPGFLMPQRAIMAGIVMFCAVLLLLVSEKAGKERRNIIAGGLAGLCVPFHFYAGPVCVLAAFLKHTADAVAEGKIHAHLRTFGLFAVAALAIGMPIYWTVFGHGAGQTDLTVSLAFGWMAPKDLAGFAEFYAKNLGIVFVASAIAAAYCAYCIAAKKKTGLMEIPISGLAFLSLLALFLFSIPNAISMPGLDWDLNKFFVFMFVPAGITAAFLVWDIAQKIKQAGPVLLLAFLFVASASTLFTLAWWYNNRWVGLTSNELQAGQWIADNTPADAVFAAYPRHNTPIDGFAGRYRVATYGWGWVNAMGNGKNNANSQLLSKMYCAQTQEQAIEIAKQLGIGYVYYGSSERENYKCDPGFAGWDEFAQVYFEGGIQIYQINRLA